MDSSLVVTTQVDSISADALVSTVPCTTACADSRNTDVPSEEQPSSSSSSRKRAATDYLSISPLEIKKIGVEISDEEAQQFQNDITRLSPVTVGLREKTLGEVSLTPQTCKRRPLESSVSSSSEHEIQLNQQVVTVEKLTDNEQFKLEADDAIRLTSDHEHQACTDETETGSETSEIIPAHAQIEFHDCAAVELAACDHHPQANLDSDPLASHHDILRRLNSDRPQEFTDDSAESLALATGVRDEVRSDGSDSGLGSEMPGDTGPNHAPESDSETLFLDRIQQVDILSTNQKDDQSSQMSLQSYPLKSNLKRRLTDCIDDGPSAKRQADEPTKKKRSIQFDAVTVYYFPRAQGFTCVPSQGGSTLGMSATHTHAERFSLTEHAAEQRRLHRARLAQLRSERAANCVVEGASSSEDPSDDTDEEPTDTEELDIDSYYFLQPVPTWQRRALLRAAGVRRIDTCEKDDCRDIRASREHCGCACKGYCDPESCPCSRANVKCQVDRAGFPCGCSRDGCANSSGRIEFNPVRVRTHFIHTLMRLEIEKKQQQEEQRNETDINSHNVQQAPNININGFESLHHYDNSQDNRNGAREDSLDLYAMRDDCYANDESIENSSGIQRKNVQQQQPEFGQTSFPSFAAAVSVGFQQNTYTDYASYQTLPSTSAATFQCRGFTYNSPYAHANTAYDASFVEETSESQYTNLNAVQPPMNAVVQQMNKLEPFSELLAGRYSYLSDVESNPVSYPTEMQAERDDAPLPKPENEVTRDDNPTDDDNFGEIIKKSMVETVSA